MAGHNPFKYLQDLDSSGNCNLVVLSCERSCLVCCTGKRIEYGVLGLGRSYDWLRGTFRNGQGICTGSGPCCT